MLGFFAFLAIALFWIPAFLRFKSDINEARFSGVKEWWKVTRLGFLGIVFFILWDYGSGFYLKQYLWFKEVGYLGILWKSYAAYFAIALVAALFAWIVLRLVLRFVIAVAPPIPEVSETRHRWDSSREKRNAEFITITDFWRKALSRFLIPTFSIIFGFVSASVGWERSLLYLAQVSSGTIDPVFGFDTSFWLFTLPFLSYLFGTVQVLAWGSLLVGVVYGAVVLWYVSSNLDKSAQESQRTGFTWRMITFGLSIACLLAAISYQLSRYFLMYSTNGAAVGATYVDLSVRMPMYMVFSVVLFGAFLFFLRLSFQRPRWFMGGVALGGVALFWVLGVGVVFPVVVQRTQVRSNELAAERPFIERTIAGTRAAYGIADRIEERNFPGVGVTEKHLSEYPMVKTDPRLWDWRVAKPIYGQLQTLRPYYGFVDTDVDRYRISGKPRQVIITARELNPDGIPEKTWLNTRLRFTHGYGVVVHFTNTKTSEGLPKFEVGNIPLYFTVPEFTVARPQIYYGEATVNTVFVNTSQKELDYAIEGVLAETIYAGTGGIPVGSGLRRLAVAWNVDGWVLWVSELVSAESKVMLARDIKTRVSQIAPFLVLDHDPYIVIRKDGTLVWMMDAYTTSSYYPYSEAYRFHDTSVNYVRNSVKVVMDAYHGSVDFYVADEKDAIIRTWQNAFPGVFRKLSDMPSDLRAHLRYGEDYFRLQGEVLLKYHMIEADQWYNKEDLRRIADEQYANAKRQQVEPYYIVTRLPGTGVDEMMLTLPFTPYFTQSDIEQKRAKENLVGWLAGRVDGEHYGKLLLYRLPRGLLRFGPMQVETLVDQNKEMSSQISLWDQRGSKVERGHLLLYPVGDALLYVEPLYITSTGGAETPQLQKVILATQRTEANGKDAKLHLVWGDTFEEALRLLMSDMPRGESVEEKVKFAREYLARYQKLMGEGKFEEAAREFRGLSDVLK